MTKKKEGAKVGRPTAMTPEKIKELEGCFASGMGDQEACLMCDVGLSTMYEYAKNNPDFQTKKELLKKKPALAMKMHIIKVATSEKINKKGEYNPEYDPKARMEACKWYLERKCKEEFSLRSEVTGKEGDAIDVIIRDDIMTINEEGA